MTALRFVLALCGVACVGCVTYERGEFAALSSTRPAIPMTVVDEDVEGRACGSLFEAPLLRAIDDAMAHAPDANALLDVSYRMERLCLVVRAKAVHLP